MKATLEMFTEYDLLKLLDEQTSLLDALVTAGEAQSTAIAAGRMNELLAVLADKQPKLERLSDLRLILESQRERMSENGFWTDHQIRATCRDHRDSAAAKFQQLLTLEQACEAALCESRKEIQQRLQDMDSGRQAASVYQAQSYGSSSPYGSPLSGGSPAPSGGFSAAG